MREVPVLGARPSNLCFGGPDGKTVYVTEVENERLVAFRTDTPGLEFTRWPGKAAGKGAAAKGKGTARKKRRK